MAADLTKLEPDFREDVTTLLANCAKRGHILKPYFATRSPLEQAKLWRQSRDAKEIRSAIAMLEKEGATYLAGVLSAAGPQNGPRVTNALPGASWHNWGLAVDCFVSDNGTAIWDANHAGYQVYAEEAVKLGLTPGHIWKMRDSVHVQAVAEGKPALSWKQIDAAMREVWR